MKIDKHAFHDHLAQLVTAWKHDKRSNDALFGGVGSMIILMGRAEESGFQKKNAMHVSRLVKLLLSQAQLIGLFLVLASWIRISGYPYGLYY